jgi:hypothetical protein
MSVRCAPYNSSNGYDFLDATTDCETLDAPYGRVEALYPMGLYHLLVRLSVDVCYRLYSALHGQLT